VLEALACGLPVCVTNIPAFRSVLGSDGVAGRLWTCGQPQALSEALVDLHARPPNRSGVRAHFDRELSFAVVGRKLNAAYRQLLERRDAADVVSRAATSTALGSGNRLNS
jgi:glycosyltransferase involved in cell wall biosynthesis